MIASLFHLSSTSRGIAVGCLAVAVLAICGGGLTAGCLPGDESLAIYVQFGVDDSPDFLALDDDFDVLYDARVAEYAFPAYQGVAIDGAGRVHIAFYDWGPSYPVDETTLHYGVFSNGVFTVVPSWERQVAGHCSAPLVLGPQGEVYIGYYNVAADCPEYSVYKDGAWSSYCVDPDDEDWGKVVSMAVDHHGAVHFTYPIGSYDVKYATNASGTWQREFLPMMPLMETGTQVCVDDAGTVCVGAFRPGRYAGGGGDTFARQLYYGTRQESGWDLHPLGGYNASGADMAVDQSSRIHFSYGLSGLTYAADIAGSLANRKIPSAFTTETAIALDGAGVPHVGAAMYRHDAYNLVYATCASGKWRLYKWGTGEGVGIGINAGRTVLVFRRNINGSWGVHVVEFRSK